MKSYKSLMKQEVWKSIPEYEGLYEVSNYGRVRSLDRKILYHRGKGYRNYPGGIIAPGVDKRYGHMSVRLCKNGTKFITYIHRLVLLAFVGPCPEGKEVRHYPDKTPSNNRLDNLCYGTHTENMKDMETQTPSSLRRKAHYAERRGSASSTALLSDREVVAIKRKLARNIPCTTIAEGYPVSVSTIYAIKSGQSWSHIT